MEVGLTAMVTKDIIVGTQVSINGSFTETSSELLNKCLEVTPESHVYEVIRVIGGTALFLEDHLERLRLSVEKLEESQRNKTQISTVQEWICAFITHIKLDCGNIRVVMSPSLVLIHQRPHHYPSEDEISKGVVLGCIEVTRADPNVKSLRQDYIEKVADGHKQVYFGSKVFEVLLEDESKRITEGSRSNVFFVDTETLRTAPDTLVLKGVTRKYVLQAAKNIGLKVDETCVTVEEIPHFKAFLCGTSLGVLPIRSICNELISSAEDPTIQKLEKEYNNIVRSYLQSHKHLQ